MHTSNHTSPLDWPITRVTGATIAWPIPIAWMSVTGGLYENGLYDEVTLVMLCVAFGW